MAREELKRVAIIEADASMQVLLKSYIGNIGAIDSIVCATASDVKLFLEDNPPVDLLILDWKFKDPNGPKLLDEFKSQIGNERIPVILISGMITKTDINVMKSFERTNFLIKPFTEEVFLSILAKSFPQLANDKNKKKPKPPTQQREISKIGDNGLFIHKGAPQPRSDLEVDKRIKSLRSADTTFNWRSKMNQTAFEALGKKRGWGSKTIAAKESASWQATQNTDKPDSGWEMSQSGRGQITGGDNIEIAANKNAGALDSSAQKIKAASAENAQITKELRNNTWEATQSKAQASGETSTQPPIPTNGATPFNDAKPGNPGAGWAAKSESSGTTGDDGLILDPGNPTNKSTSEFKSAQKNAVPAPTGAPGGAQTNPVAALFRNALIVEKDPALQTLVVRYLKALGVDKTTTTGSVKKAWESLAAGTYDFVLMDWSPAESTGLALYSRIRKSEVGRHLPMIVTSGVVGRKDFRLLEENPSTRLVEKPFQLATLKKEIDELCKRRSDHFSIIDRMARLAKEADVAKKDTSFVLDKIRREYQRPLPALVAIGEYYLKSGRYNDAERTFAIAHRLDNKNVAVLSGLAKAYHKLNRTKEALPLLEKAEGLSPQNIERLCMLGEIGLSIKDPEKARGYFQQALTVDDADTTAKAGMVLSDNFSQHLKETGNNAQLSDQLASVLNTVGITFVRNQQFQKGVDQYLAALNFVTEGIDRAKLEFNLGLAFLRQKKYRDAEQWLEAAVKRGGQAFPKAQEYLIQVKKLNKPAASA